MRADRCIYCRHRRKESPAKNVALLVAIIVLGLFTVLLVVGALAYSR